MIGLAPKHLPLFAKTAAQVFGGLGGDRNKYLQAFVPDFLNGG